MSDTLIGTTTRIGRILIDNDDPVSGVLIEVAPEVLRAYPHNLLYRKVGIRIEAATPEEVAPSTLEIRLAESEKRNSELRFRIAQLEAQMREDWKLIDDLRVQVDRLKKIGDQVRNCAQHIGTVSVGDADVIARSEAAINAWDRAVAS